MSANAMHVRVAAKLYECRTACRTLFGDRYASVITPYTDVIRRVAAARKVETLTAAMQMADEMRSRGEASGGNDPIITLCLMAAAVDIIEPTGCH